MNAKVEDNNTNFEVPEASPDGNSKEQAPAAPNRKMLWMGLLALVFIAAIVGITVPLVNKNKDKDKNTNNGDENKKVESNNLSASTFASIDASQCFEPIEGDTCSTKESYEECQTLANNGCKNIYSAYTCPPQYRCGDPTGEGAVACLMDVRACPDGTAMIGRSGPDCEFNFEDECPQAVQLPAQPDIVACQMDIRACPDGVNSVGRSGPNCEFKFENDCPQAVQLPAQPDSVACQMDIRTCPDGITMVGRSAPSCEFNFEDECPQADQLPAQPDSVACQMDIRACPDGVNSAGRSGPNCEFNFENDCPQAVQLPVQPNVIACQLDVRPCPDGMNSVGRSGPNCDFNFEAECPQAVQLPANPDARVECNGDKMVCPSRVAVERDAENNCEFATCPETMMCTMELSICGDGTSVGRIGINCAFEACPDNSCPLDGHLCEETGEDVSRDPAFDCNFICNENGAVQLPEEGNKHPCNNFPGCEPCLNSRMECAWTGGRCEPDCVLADAPCYHPRNFPEMIGPEICAIAAINEAAPAACTLELRYCDDGSAVGRGGPNCEFETCPEELVSSETKSNP